MSAVVRRRTAATTQWDTCSLCPRLCRSSCPVATGTAREAAVPAQIARVLREWEDGRTTDAQAAHAATLCTDCGACRDHCHLHRPLPAQLRTVRGRLLDRPEIEPLGVVEGEGDSVVIEADARPLARWLSEHLGRAHRRLSTEDQLGVGAAEHPGFDDRAHELVQLLGDVDVVVADGGVARVLERTGVAFRWLHEVVPDLGADAVGSCRAGGARPMACCGGAEPLRSHHPEDARRVGARFVQRAEGGTLLDAACRNHLAACSRAVRDVVDVLGERVGA